MIGTMAYHGEVLWKRDRQQTHQTVVTTSSKVQNGAMGEGKEGRRGREGRNLYERGTALSVWKPRQKGSYMAHSV